MIATGIRASAFAWCVARRQPPPDDAPSRAQMTAPAVAWDETRAPPRADISTAQRGAEKARGGYGEDRT